MKKIITQLAKLKIKVAYPSVDDQPGFINRDKADQDAIWDQTTEPDSEEDVKKRFENKKKKRNRDLNV